MKYVQLGEALPWWQKRTGLKWEGKGRKQGATPHLAERLWAVHVYLSVKRLINVHSIVFALLDEHIPTFPDEACGRVGVDGAAQEYCLLLVVTAAHVADGLVYCQNWYIKICKINGEENNKTMKTLIMLQGENCTIKLLLHHTGK